MTDKNNSKRMLHKIRVTCLSISVCAAQFHIQANENSSHSLTLTPNKCVSLRQGQTCYANIELQWTSAEQTDVCIYASTKEQPLECWTQVNMGRLKTEFSSNENTFFYLRHEQKNVAQVELKMSWVYKRKRSSNSWRVF